MVKMIVAFGVKSGWGQRSEVGSVHTDIGKYFRLKVQKDLIMAEGK